MKFITATKNCKMAAIVKNWQLLSTTTNSK